MKVYHKIQTLFKRDPNNKNKTIIEGQYSLPEFEFLKDNNWIFTEKVDGTNIRVIFSNNEITFGGKEDNAQIPSKLVNYLIKTFIPLRNTFITMFGENSNVCLYGEGYGQGIQSGGNYSKDQQFVLFDVKVEDWWLKREDIQDIATKLQIKAVPIIGEGNLDEMTKLVKEEYESFWGGFIAEGIVARPEIELKTRAGERIITKLKCKDFVR